MSDETSLLRESLKALLFADSVRQKAFAVTSEVESAFDAARKDRSTPPEVKAHLERRDQLRRDGDLAAIATAVDRLAEIDTDAAVVAITEVFKSARVPYRLVALNALGRMTVPTAQNSLRRRRSFWSFASREEKLLADSLLSHREKVKTKSSE